MRRGRWNSRASACTRFAPLRLKKPKLQLWWKFFVRGGAMLLDPLVKGRQIKGKPDVPLFSL